MNKIAESIDHSIGTPDEMVRKHFDFDPDLASEWECQIVGTKLVGAEDNLLVRQRVCTRTPVQVPQTE